MQRIWSHHQPQEDRGDVSGYWVSSFHPHQRLQPEPSQSVPVPWLDYRLQPIAGAGDQRQDCQGRRDDVEAPEEGVGQQKPDQQHQDAGVQSWRP